MHTRLELTDLRLFCQVAQALGFAAVARSEGVSPAYVTKRIAALERALEVKLFHRTTRNVTLTQQGGSILDWALRILEDVDSLGEAIAATQGAARGLLRISSSPGFGRDQLAPAFAEMIRRHPGLKVDLELFDRPVEVIREGFDLDVRVGGTHEPNLIARPLARNYRVLCASPDYLAAHGAPRRLDELGQHRCIVTRERDQSFAVWRLAGPDGVESVKVPAFLACNDGGIVHQWGLEGHGIFLRSIWDVRANLQAGRLVRVLADYRQDADVAALYPQRLEGSGRLRACVRFLEEWFAARGNWA